MPVTESPIIKLTNEKKKKFPPGHVCATLPLHENANVQVNPQQQYVLPAGTLKHFI